jgi:quercetin dioxygenase-like cupin family protein
VPIEFLDLLDGGGWQPLVPDVGVGSVWSEGGSLAEAPVDVEATFAGAVWRATGIDPTFGLTGVRLRKGFRVPRHHHDQGLLILVFEGSLVVASSDGCSDAEPHEQAVLGPGQFCVIEADTAYSLTAGPAGATFLTSWPQDARERVTCWHPDPAWAPAEGRATA